MRLLPVSCLRWVGPTCLLVGLAATPVQGWIRPWYEDAEVVARSELIVVGHLEAGSVRRVPHQDEAGGASVDIHHATLVVTEVLQGTQSETRIPLILYHGLWPIVGGGDDRPDGSSRRFGRLDRKFPRGAIVIGDVATHQFLPLPVADAREDHLWFLRRRSGLYGREPGQGDFGIVDPEDLQPITLKAYFLAYREPDPEAAVRRLIATQPNLAPRAKRFLDHQEIVRILQTANPRTRAERLLPYLAEGIGSRNFAEVRRGILACGPEAAPLLAPLYREPKSSALKCEVIALWAEMGDRACVPELIALLGNHERFWADQKLEADWWNRAGIDAETIRRREVWSEDREAVRALGRLGDPSARPAIESTLRRWRAIPFPPRELAEDCEQALRSLSPGDGPKPDPDRAAPDADGETR